MSFISYINTVNPKIHIHFIFIYILYIFYIYFIYILYLSKNVFINKILLKNKYKNIINFF